MNGLSFKYIFTFWDGGSNMYMTRIELETTGLHTLRMRIKV